MRHLNMHAKTILEHDLSVAAKARGLKVYGYGAGYYNPGYYSTDKNYFLESNLYDAKTEKLILSIQSKAVNPAAIEKSSQTYTKSLMFEIDKLKWYARK